VPDSKLLRRIHWPERVVRGAPAWERIARPGFAGAHLSYDLRIRFKHAVDWSELVDRLRERYEEKSKCWVAPGRRMRFEPRVIEPEDPPGSEQADLAG
jgi:hypothetical protein